MATRENIRSSKMAEIGATFVATTYVWNYHKSDGIGGKGSNVRRDVKAFFDQNPNANTCIVFLCAIGRSGHSKSRFAIWDVTGINTNEIEFGAEFSRDWIEKNL